MTMVSLCDEWLPSFLLLTLTLEFNSVLFEFLTTKFPPIEYVIDASLTPF